ncbi:hypothetical protein DNTS_006690 [Danionella cerebrum]|uniref:RRM domain-containing protein n=1 Tax=Danionella cerebrum TaxID=2873325 RepID=A0A553PWI6_9TELE|nr:hypothetical protein DNTS_006690 [Danionella translucida]
MVSNPLDALGGGTLLKTTALCSEPAISPGLSFSLKSGFVSRGATPVINGLHIVIIIIVIIIIIIFIFVRSKLRLIFQGEVGLVFFLLCWTGPCALVCTPAVLVSQLQADSVLVLYNWSGQRSGEALVTFPSEKAARHAVAECSNLPLSGHPIRLLCCE